ncbi:MAG: hypothetical protein MUP36_03425 [Demequinaceae bacterium]|nr:hypothetical protein [Demequinaceae bacterium]
MGYLNSTPPQATRVVGGWTLGIGIVLFAATFRELGTAHPPSGAITGLVLLVAGGLALFLGSRLLTSADRANRRFFAENAGTEILARRRVLQVRLETTRWRLFLVLLSCSVCWLILAGTYSCVDGVCTGFAPGHGTLIDVFRWMCVIVGLTTLAATTLARVHSNETDRWEDLASDYLRRRDDGPVPGLKRSRWE